MVVMDRRVLEACVERFGVSFVHREVVVKVLRKLCCVWLFVGRGCW